MTSRNIQVKDGKVDTSVAFSTPGEYVLRARASDRILFVDKEIKVTVTGGTSGAASSGCAHPFSSH